MVARGHTRVRRGLYSGITSLKNTQGEEAMKRRPVFGHLGRVEPVVRPAFHPSSALFAEQSDDPPLQDHPSWKESSLAPASIIPARHAGSISRPSLTGDHPHRRPRVCLSGRPDAALINRPARAGDPRPATQGQDRPLHDRCQGAGRRPSPSAGQKR